jgi:hypothetical protein
VKNEEYTKAKLPPPTRQELRFGAAYATVSTQKPWKNLSFSAFKSQYLLQKRYPRMAFLCYSGKIEGRTANGKHTSLRQRL